MNGSLLAKDDDDAGEIEPFFSIQHNIHGNEYVVWEWWGWFPIEVFIDFRLNHNHEKFSGDLGVNKGKRQGTDVVGREV